MILVVLFGLVTALAACTPAAAPTPTPTKAPAAAPTKAAEATKPPAPVPTTAPATPTPKPVTIKIGNIQSISEAGIYIAMERGYFKEQGITIELNAFRNTAEAMAPLATEKLDILIASLSQALLAAVDRGVEMRIAAGQGVSQPNWEFGWVVLRKDLADSGKVKTPADLKGEKIAVSSLGGLGDQIAQTLLEQAGLKPTDAEIVALPFAEQTPAYNNKVLAAGYSVEPYIATGFQQGFTTKWIPTSRIFGGKLQAGIVVFGPALLKDQDAGRRWMIAYLKGVRDYLKTFTTKEGRTEVVNYLVKYSSVKDPKLYDVMEMPYIDPNGLLDKKSTDLQYKFYVDKGLYTGKKTFDDITDMSYVEYAVQKLGKQ